MSRYDDALSLRDARALYFAHAGFDERSYSERWVRLQAGPVPIFLPNSAARVRAVRIHDLHHVVTGYETTWTGESAIAAWEVASGCADHLAAWILNLGAMAIGLAIAPRVSFEAFVRGRHTRNFYREEFGEGLLAERVGAARHRLGLDRPTEHQPTTASDGVAFVGWSLAAVAVLLAHFAPLAGLVAGIAWLLGRVS